VVMDRESVNRAFETTIEEGVRFQRCLLYCGFGIDTGRKAWLF